MTVRDMPEAVDSNAELAEPEGAVGDSLSVAVWTFVSRFTGVLRGIMIAAVLGITYFANTYQFTNSLPNLVFYGLLAGAMFSSLLVPALVGHIDSGNRQAAARTAGGLLGVALLGMLAVVPVAAVATPWLLRLASGGAGAAANQAHTGAILVLLLLPQVPLYAIVGTATAVMNAHRRFALAAAAPALENLGTIAVLGVVAVVYPRVAAEHSVPLSLLLLLGLGTTGSVLLHASVQWWGAKRAGIVLVPNAGWRDPQVRETIHRALPALAQAALAEGQIVVLLLAADRVPGGVVGFQLAINFYFLPIALAATPVALSLVPRLSRMTAPHQARMFRDTYVRGLVLACFFAVPAATAYAVLGQPIAGMMGFGAFGAAGGRELIAAALRGMAPAILGETLFLVTTYACYARKETGYPLRGMVIQAVVSAAGIVAAALNLRGPALLTGLGLAFSAGALVAAAYLVHHLMKGLPKGEETTLPPLLRSAVCSLIMAGPALLTADGVARLLPDPAGRVLAMLAATLVGAVIYFAVQAALRAPQMDWLAGGLRMWRVRMPAPPTWARLPLTGARSFLRRHWVDVTVLALCLAIGALTGVKVKDALILTAVVLIGGLVVAKPAAAAYLLIFLTPLIVGLDVGSVVPLVRPNEALLALFAVAIAVRWLARVRTGDRQWPKLDGVDFSLIALCLTSSALPLIMMVGRQRAIQNDDILYSIVLWKLTAEYVVVRSVIVTREQAMRCLALFMASAAIVCVVGILQTLNKFGALTLLAKYYAPMNTTSDLSQGRGSSLLGLPAAVADLAIIGLAIAVALIVRGSRWRWLLSCLAVSYAFAVVAAAEFSTVLGLLVAVVVIVILTKSTRIIGYAIPVAVIGAVFLWPVIEIRLSGFQSASGLPSSWLVRLYNLRTYFWPPLFSDYNWILGVRPSARVAVPTTEYGYVWIESGYTWLLWGGGVPLFASYAAFAVTSIRKGWRFSRRADAAGVAGAAIAVIICVQVVVMLFDPHLSYRGSGDAIFMLLALVRRLPGQRRGSPADSRRAATAVPDLQEVLA
jgi:putative peptidoglycan lipid II flippase